MKLQKWMTIGFKYVGIGIFAFTLALLILTKLLTYGNTSALAAGISVMSAMVMAASAECYKAGKNDRASSRQ